VQDAAQGLKVGFCWSLDDCVERTRNSEGMVAVKSMTFLKEHKKVASISIRIGVGLGND
jgi:hypothetical protein